MNHQYIRIARELRNGNVIARGIVVRWIHQRANNGGRTYEAYGVAVRLRVLGQFRTHPAAATTAIIDDDSLAQRFGQPDRHRARHYVLSAAGR